MNSHDEYVSGDMRGAHLKLAQRHKKLTPGQFRGSPVFEPEVAHPGVVGQAALRFTTSSALPVESRITCVLPDHGWRFVAVESGGDLNAVLRLPRGDALPTLKTTWTSATRTLEFTLQGEAIAAHTDVVVVISGVRTPEASRPAAEAVVTAYEKLVVRATVPPSTRGGQIIDGPTAFAISKIPPGELAGVKRWQPFNCCPGVVSEVTVSLTVHGCIPRNGSILIQLPSDGWDMEDAPAVQLRTAEDPGQPVTAAWVRKQHTLEVHVGEYAIKAGSRLVLTIGSVTNPTSETMNSGEGHNSNNSGSIGSGGNGARVTTLVGGGGVIDGPSPLDVALISELRESDFHIAKQVFALVSEANAGVVTVDTLPEVLRRAGVVLSPELFASLIVAHLPPIPVPPAPTPDADGVDGAAVEHQTEIIPRIVSLADFLCVFAITYAPAYKFGQALRLASGRGEADKIGELITRGCDANAKDGAGWSALHYASDFGQLAALTAITESVAVVHASNSHSVRAIPALDLNARDVSGWTPLICAAANGHTTLVEKLLALGADARIRTAEGRTALHWAATRGMQVCIPVLLAAGVPKDETDRSGWTALHCAEMHGHQACAQLLMDQGVNPETKDRMQYKAGHYSSLLTNAAVAR